VYLDGVPQGTSEQEECGGMLKALLAHEHEGVLQGLDAMLVFAEVVLEELRHAFVSLALEQRA